ncbi:hypothetical protein [Microbacterium sp. A84]|uniref:hypothetical protein n=1 Tax=Microbacterium sp. A84 TaxID=3450715 RepID=UPI003F426F75
MNNFGVQLSYASVDRGDGSDPRADARGVLTRLRVPAGLFDGDGEWDDSQQEAVVTIPVTDAGRVLTLTAEDTIATTLTVPQLRKEFADAGLTLWMQSGDDSDDDECCGEGCCRADADGDLVEPAAAEALVADPVEEASLDESAFDAPPVHISVFSHRGPFAGRMIAQLNGLEVQHVESGSWSLLRFESDDSTNAGIATKSEMPVIELNRVDDAGDWFEVTTNGGVHQFWPGAERHTVPVLDLDAITVPETAEICRRLISDGDGSRDELAEVATHSRVDVSAAHRALQPEALGGVVGMRARQEAFLAAFGIPADLIAAAFDDADPAQTDLAQTDLAVTDLAVQRFEPTSWGTAILETLIDGIPAMTPLTRRDRPLARMADALRRNPALAAALSVSELALGVAASRRRGFGRFLGILLIIDAVADLVICVVRARRR